MAKKRVRLAVRDDGLWVVGSKDRTPPGKARRYKGVHHVKTGIIRSRHGSTLLYDLNAHSLTRFDDVRFQGVGTALYRDGSSILTGLDGTRLAFMRMPPTAGIQDYLFVAGGGLARKVDASGNVTQWGIDPPADGMTAAADTPLTREIDDFDATTGWSATGGSSVSTEGTIKQEGTNSLKWVIGGDGIKTLEKSITIDLSSFASGETSPDEDVIRVWLRVDDPADVGALALQFSLGNTSFATDTYTAPINFNTQYSDGQRVLGIAEVLGISEQQAELISEDYAQTVLSRESALRGLNVTSLSDRANVWAEIRIPKTLFTKDGSAAVDWSDVQAVRFICKADGSVNIYIDQMRLEGGYGLQGNYKYLLTYKNSTTGTRSNSNTTPVEVADVFRQSITLSSIPQSSDAQADKIEIWRTVGNGSLYFLVDTIADGTTSYTDEIPDFPGLDSNASSWLQTTELPTDNIPPDDTFEDTWGPHGERVWWCRNSTVGARGRVYYSPVGRAEAVESFIELTNDDDPTQKGISWDGRNWVFTEEHLFRIDGTGPFLARKVQGVLGTTMPHTVKPTPYGICYQAHDGVRLFDGTQSVLIHAEGVLTLFRGEDAEGTSAFEGVVAGYAEDEYILSDLSQTLNLNLVDGRWHNHGAGLNAIYTENDTGNVIATLNSQVVNFEAEGTNTDAGAAIPFDYEPASVITGPDPAMFERVYIDLNTNEQSLNVEIITDVGTFVKPPATTNGRSVVVYTPGEQKALKCRVFGVRIYGDLTDSVEIYHIWVDVELPDQPTTVNVGDLTDTTATNLAKLLSSV